MIEKRHSQPAVDEATTLAGTVKDLLGRGHGAEARAQFGGLVALLQRRACRIAYHYLRDAADADEAVQDAFVKAFSHLGSFREELPFRTWFTRILVNGCLDRLKARARRHRRSAELLETLGPRGHETLNREALSPEHLLLRREQRRSLAVALQRLPARQRLVFVLTYYEQQSFREISTMTGLAESTVRVHLFRAIRALRALLVTEPESARVRARATGTDGQVMPHGVTG